MAEKLLPHPQDFEQVTKVSSVHYETIFSSLMFYKQIQLCFHQEEAKDFFLLFPKKKTNVSLDQ